MMLKSLMYISAGIFAALLALMGASAAMAGGYGGGGGHCHGGGGGGGHNIWIYKPITINKSINIWKEININNSVSINKSIVINKGGVDVNVSAMASASANASAAASVFYGGSYVADVVANKSNGEIGNAHAAETCEEQEATVVKAIHAVCVASDGREFPASHMIGDTWVEASYEGEVARCIPGSVVKVIIGDVVQSDQGMAGTYESGQRLMCGPHEALRHYKDGMLKCAPAQPVPDCTERTNLRRYGTADFFFSYRANVCAAPAREARARTLDLSGMSLEGGVGD
jgi:hypothetical protein